MNRVLSSPARIHHCSPGWEIRHSEGVDHPLGPHDYYHDLRLPIGTVWECDCGKVWVCVKGDGSDFVKRGGQAVDGLKHWRPEKRRERRKREKPRTAGRGAYVGSDLCPPINRPDGTGAASDQRSNS